MKLNGNSEIPLTPVPKSSTNTSKFGGPPKKFPLLSQNYIINEAETEQSIEKLNFFFWLLEKIIILIFFCYSVPKY